MSFEDDVLQDFLTEAKEGLEKLDEEFVELERDPQNTEILKSIFRTMHTLKGTAGFFGFKTLEGIAHFAEDILSKLRDGLVVADEEIIDILLRAVDHIKAIVAHLEEHKQEPVDETYLDFLVELSNFAEKIAKRAKGEVGGTKPADKRPLESKASKEEPVEEKDTEEKPKEEKAEDEEPAGEKALEDKKSEEVRSSSSTPSITEKKKEEAPKTSKVAPQVTLTETHIRVDVKLLDHLMNLAGELVLARNRLVQIAGEINDTELMRATQSLSLVTTEMQETIMKTRMQPIGTVFNKFPRIVRDLARSTGKKVNLHIEGADTELDRSIIEAIKDPLTHLVRNSIDHGIESPDERVQIGKPAVGTLVLRAYHEGGQVIIEIEDDGRGIDVEKVKKKAIEKGLITPEEAERMSDREAIALIFRPGFSTAEKVTNISGRGVGMDVVKTNIERLGGSIEINSVKGSGTTVRVKIPLTLAIVPALIVLSGGERYAIPQVNLKELVNIESDEEIHRIGNSEFYRLRGEIIPLIRLSRILGSPNGDYERSLVILSTGVMDFGLLVDEVRDSEEIVVKPLGRLLKGIPIYAGATIMGDGKVALILDVVGLSRYVGFKAEEMERAFGEEDQRAISGEEKQFILLFNVHPSEQFAIPLSLISRLDKIEASKLEYVGGKEVVQYKGKSVPVIRLENYLPIQPLPEQEEYNLLFFEDRKKKVAILVSQIVDSLETDLELDEDIYHTEGILGNRIINGRTTIFVDIYKIIEMYDPDWFSRPEILEKKRILYAEDSAFYRQLVKNYLQSAGYEVEVAEDGLEAWEKLQQKQFDLLITDIEMPKMDGFELAKKVRSDERLANMPIMALTSLSGEDVYRKAKETGIDEFQVKLDREAVIRTAAELLAEKTAEATA
ncbi:chemotaxis protein CheW [Thermosulfurimonas dismutans]|uniref:histidine kinase n=1 Tax=Thermosulfurimonas dismutans TaxID=999894 RepID=A0A179D5H4_9BACT|nr:chemotaxis protein CheW [Thermosulfurimonas dismutans]OAQ21296.1 Signal transduction histidine kinase CheA [Thermosulfurimonas dismutans]